MNISGIGSAYALANEYVRNAQNTQSGSFLDVMKATAANRMAGTTQTAGASEVKSVSLEDMLRAKYPNLVYNVGDASSSHWRTRNDYPFELLFQQGERSVQMLENWRPMGSNPQFQRHLAIAPNSKAVMIHPKAQERMENDPAFAEEVFKRIEAWWAYDIARNEAICPGCTVGMSHAIAIGEDGEIANVLSTGGDDSALRRSTGGGKKDEYDWWEERMARHAYFMQLLIEGRIEWSVLMRLRAAQSAGSGGSTGYTASFAMGAANAEAQLTQMIQGGLREVLGDTVAGTPTDAVIENAWSDISRARSMQTAFSMM